MTRSSLTFAMLVFSSLTMVSSAGQAQDATAGAAVFKKCMACHAVGEGAKTKVGPELNGVVGRVAGSIEGYNYSQAMKTAGLIWDQPTLTEYLRAPRTLVPGTKMAFPGLKVDADLADVIAYLNQFAADGTSTPAQ